MKSECEVKSCRGFQIATPISHLFGEPSIARELMARSDCLEGRDKSLEAGWPGVRLFHTDIEPVHELGASAWAHLEAIRRRTPELRLLSMHMASCYSAPIVVSGKFQAGGKRYGRDELLRCARENLSRIKALFGPDVELAVENNNFYATPAYDYVCDPEFISEVVRGNDIRFLFDVAHAFVSSVNKGMPLDSYLAGLPLEKTVQIHISQHRVDGPLCAVDAHADITEHMYEFVRKLLGRITPSYVTVEYYRDPHELLSALKRINSLRNER